MACASRAPRGDTGRMRKSRSVRPFAEVLRDLAATPGSSVAPPPDDSPRDPSGRRYHLVDASISSGRALELAAAGAAVAWDACGCQGFCGYAWLDRVEIRDLVASGRPKLPRKRDRWGRLSQWQADDGTDLVLAEADVRWASHLA
jgi:hypothetical protein